VFFNPEERQCGIRCSNLMALSTLSHPAPVLPRLWTGSVGVCFFQYSVCQFYSDECWVDSFRLDVFSMCMSLGVYVFFSVYVLVEWARLSLAYYSRRSMLGLCGRRGAPSLPQTCPLSVLKPALPVLVATWLNCTLEALLILQSRANSVLASTSLR
jgi:hypothetical protein